MPDGLSPDDHPGLASGDADAADLDSLNGNSPADVAQATAARAAAAAAAEPDSLSTRTTDSGFSELTSSSQEPPEEKETSCEKTFKPEGTI